VNSISLKKRYFCRVSPIINETKPDIFNLILSPSPSLSLLSLIPFETRSYCVAQDGLKVLIILPKFLKCWDHRHASPCLGKEIILNYSHIEEDRLCSSFLYVKLACNEQASMYLLFTCTNISLT
jgi:hypothetical protein